MKPRIFIIAGAVLLSIFAGTAPAQTVEVRRVTSDDQVLIAKRHTLAIRYKDNDDTSVNMVGTPLNAQAIGKAEVKGIPQSAACF